MIKKRTKVILVWVAIAIPLPFVLVSSRDSGCEQWKYIAGAHSIELKFLGKNYDESECRYEVPKKFNTSKWLTTHGYKHAPLFDTSRSRGYLGPHTSIQDHYSREDKRFEMRIGEPFIFQKINSIVDWVVFWD